MIEKLGRVISPRVAQLGLVAVLVVAAVFLADAEGGRQIADDAATQRAAESVLSAAAVTESVVQQGIVVGRAWEEGVATDDEAADMVTLLGERVNELEARVDGLAVRIDDDRDLRSAYNRFRSRTESVMSALDFREIDQAVESSRAVSEEFETLTAVARSIQNERQAHINAVGEGISNVATAARVVAGLGIPALVLLFLYRSLRIRQRQVLLRSELQREKDLRKSKDQFLAGASHYLNTPLSAVLGFARLLADRSRSYNASVRNELTELLAVQAEEASHVAEDLLIGARSSMDELTLEHEDVDLRGVVEDVTDYWESSQLATLEITGNSTAQGDRKRVAQVLRNLLHNAQTFGGDPITVSISERFNRSIVEVIDNGDGIPEGEEEAVFQPYYTARQSEHLPASLGLGLSVSRRLARLMGGELSYERNAGTSIFRLSLPSAVDDRTGSELANRIIDPAAGKPTLSDITAVLEEGGPRLVYQPIVQLQQDNRGGARVIGYEALARFPFASPPEWFETARLENLGVDLELACIGAAISRFSTEHQDQYLSVNVSDEALKSSELVHALDGFDASRLVLELSETATIRSYQATKAKVDRLKGQGIRLAIDDLGAAEIDLWHITRLGADIVKIDMSLVRELDNSPVCRGLIRAVVAMAQELGLMVIAEGVETEVEHQTLLDLDVPYGQGYLYGKPEPLEWATRVLFGSDAPTSERELPTWR